MPTKQPVIHDIRHAAYIIPFRIKNGRREVALIEYSLGANGTIGGRFEESDTDARTALRRELIEELNSGAEKMADMAMEIPEPYQFDVAPERILLRHAKKEVHHFFFAHIPADMEIKFCEKCAGNVNIIWVDAELLLDDKVIGFADMREYFAKNIMPIIHKI